MRTDATGDTCILNFQVSGSFAHQFVVGIPVSPPSSTSRRKVMLIPNSKGDTLSNYGTGSSTLGGGLLDNLRGQCGVITDWTANADDDDNLVARFSTTIFCGADNVHDAIWLANGKHYDADCTYEDHSWDSVKWTSGVTLGLQALFDTIGILVPRT